MSRQNIYDDETFFEGYKNLRQNKNSANELFEKPALFSLLPDLNGKSILDLGCGYGENCLKFRRMGASRITGVDISSKMLSIAKKENCDPQIEYRNMAMEDLALMDKKFDIVVSSLALHYVKDYPALVKEVHRLLNGGGYFIFSQEHPINTCFTSGERWTRNAEGKKIFANISNYSVDGMRESKWFVECVQKYHRTFSTVINTLIEQDFSIIKILEPVPDEKTVREHPEQSDLLHKPDFLLVKAQKPKAE